MTSALRPTMAGATDAGRLREQNEDAVALRPELGLAVLADGMGGHQAGEVASAIATETIVEFLAEHIARPGARKKAGKPRPGGKGSLIAQAVEKANAAIFRAAQERREYRGMGSTVVVALVDGDRLCFGHAGDSRLYRLRSGRLEQLTSDHSLVQDFIDRGLFTPEEARRSMAKNVVTRALGVDRAIQADVAETALRPGDAYLLCSDGLTDVVDDAEIAEILNGEGAQPDDAVRRLIERANALGGPDNISAVVLRIGK